MKAMHIYKKTGYLGLFRGFFATFNRDVFSYGVYFLVYFGLKDYCKSKYKGFGPLEQIFVGAFAGIATWVVTYPFDTVKTIIQTMPLKDKTPRQIEVFRNLHEIGGVKEIFRGASPSLLLSVIFSSCQFLFFDISKTVITKFTVRTEK